MALLLEHLLSIWRITGTKRQVATCVTQRAERIIAIVKDLILFFGGLAGIAWQQISGNINIYLLIIFVTMTGVPGLMNLVFLLRGTATGLSSPPPVSSPSSSDSPSASQK